MLHYQRSWEAVPPSPLLSTLFQPHWPSPGSPASRSCSFCGVCCPVFPQPGFFFLPKVFRSPLTYHFLRRSSLLTQPKEAHRALSHHPAFIFFSDSSLLGMFCFCAYDRLPFLPPGSCARWALTHHLSPFPLRPPAPRCRLLPWSIAAAF